MITVIATWAVCCGLAATTSHSDSGVPDSQSHYVTATEVPYHLLIVASNKYCSGCLIGSRIVLSLAYCFHNPNNRPITVKMGSSSISSAGHTYRVIEVKRHEYYKHRSELDNDIGLGILHAHVAFGNKVQKALIRNPMLPSPKFGNIFYVAGWSAANGTTKYMELAIFASMTVIDSDKCSQYYPNLLTRSMFCAVYRPIDKDTHPVNIGGGALYGGGLIGITAHVSDNSVDAFIVAIFTNVTYFYKWIQINTISLLTKYCVPKRSTPSTHYHQYDTTYSSYEYDYTDETSMDLET